MGNKNKKYSGEFKEEVVKWMIENHAGKLATANHFQIRNPTQPEQWKKKYEKEGLIRLYSDKRGSGKGGGRPPSSDGKSFKTLEEEMEYLRAGNAYLKKLKALIQPEK